MLILSFLTISSHSWFISLFQQVICNFQIFLLYHHISISNNFEVFKSLLTISLPFDRKVRDNQSSFSIQIRVLPKPRCIPLFLENLFNGYSFKKKALSRCIIYCMLHLTVQSKKKKKLWKIFNSTLAIITPIYVDIWFNRIFNELGHLIVCCIFFH